MAGKRDLTIGVLALQGGFEVHLNLLSSLHVSVKKVRRSDELVDCDGLILPGGESTTMTLLIEKMKLKEPLIAFARIKPLFATCAGMILLAKLGLLDIALERNAYGRQCDSFSTQLHLFLPVGGHVPFDALFIRAPKIKALLSDKVKVISKHEKDAVLVEQGKILAATFHPELTSNPTLHRYFIDHFF